MKLTYILFILQNLLRAFSGREVLTNEIQEFVEDKTAFLDKHMKAALKEHEVPTFPIAERILVRDIKADGTRRRKGTFPEGVYVKFPN